MFILGFVAGVAVGTAWAEMFRGWFFWALPFLKSTEQLVVTEVLKKDKLP